MKALSRGFTLIEMLITLAVLGILTAIGVFNFQSFTAQQRVNEAQQVLAQTLNRARGEARKTSTNQMLTWTSNSISINGKIVNIPNGVTLSTSDFSTGLGYSAPYGRTIRTTGAMLNSGGIFTLSGMMGKGARVKIIGVTGKVIRDAL